MNAPIDRVGETFPFAPGMPFYPMVTTYLSAAAGLGTVYLPDIEPVFGAADTLLLPVLSIRRAMKLSLRQTIAAARSGKAPSLDEAMATLSAMLVNTAYESVKDRLAQVGAHPTVELFRQLRNAAAHGNRFFFKAHEPKRVAHWQGLSIGCTQKGNQHPLQGKPCFGVFIGSGDIIQLLWDVQALL